MSHLDELRRDFIEASRAYVRGPGNGDYQLAKDWTKMVAALEKLEMAERPDPWKLLEKLHTYALENVGPFAMGYRDSVRIPVQDALAWRLGLKDPIGS